MKTIKKQDGWLLISVIFVLLIGSTGVYYVTKKGDFAFKKVEARQMADDFNALRNNIITEFSHLDSFCSFNQDYAINNNLLPTKFWVAPDANGNEKIWYGDKKQVRLGFIHNLTMLPPNGDQCKGFYIKYTRIDKDVARRLVRDLHPYFDSIRWGNTTIKHYGEYDEAAANQQYNDMVQQHQQAGINFTYYGK